MWLVTFLQSRVGSCSNSRTTESVEKGPKFGLSGEKESDATNIVTLPESSWNIDSYTISKRPNHSRFVGDFCNGRSAQLWAKSLRIWAGKSVFWKQQKAQRHTFRNALGILILIPYQNVQITHDSWVTSVTDDRLNCGQKAYAFERGKAFFENNKRHSATPLEMLLEYWLVCYTKHLNPRRILVAFL